MSDLYSCEMGRGRGIDGHGGDELSVLHHRTHQLLDMLSEVMAVKVGAGRSVDVSTDLMDHLINVKDRFSEPRRAGRTRLAHAPAPCGKLQSKCVQPLDYFIVKILGERLP